MSRSTMQRVSVCAAIALAALSSLPAAAELPLHPAVALFFPKLSECCSEDGQLLTEPKFGSAVAIRNGIAFIGIPAALPTARVAVFNQSAAGWVRTATLTAPDAASVSQFGRAITFRDGLVVIASAAAVHVFKRINGVWTAIQKLAPPDDRDFPTGAALRYENGILAIGSRGGGTLGNVVFIYELSSNGKFVKRATLKPADAAPTDSFGADVGVAGNAVVVGAPGQSAAYVFKRRSDGRWVQAQKLVTAQTSVRGDFGAFGEAVAIDRGMIIVGAPSYDCDGGVFCDNIIPPLDNVASGAAFVFVSVAGQYVEVLKLRPRPDEQFGFMDFGYRIAMFDKHIVVAANEQHGGIDAHPHGYEFTYTRDGATVIARGLASAHITASYIGLANNLLLVGSPADDDRCTEGCRGNATIYDLNRYVE